MRILHFVSSFEPYSSIRSIVEEIAATLQKQGFDNYVYTTSLHAFPQKRLKDVRIKTFPSVFRISKFRFSHRLLMYSDFTKEDIIHAHGYRGFETFAASIHKRRFGVPLIISPYGNIPYMYTLKEKFVRILQDALELKNPSRRCDFFLAETLFEKNNLIQYGIPEDKIRVIYGKPIDTFLFSKRKSKEYGPTVLYVGRIHPIKGIDILIQAFRKLLNPLPEAKLYIVGPIYDSSYYLQLRSLVTKLGLQSNVVFYGAVPKEELPALFSSAHLLVLPSRWESLGGVLLEAQSCECPVIASGAGGTREIVIQGYTGYIVNPINIEELSNRMEVVLGDKRLRESLGKNARKFVSKFFSTQAFASRLLSVYKELFETRN